MTLEPKKRRGAPPPTGRANRMNSGTLCTAKRRDGEQCTNFAIKGADVCRFHGGSAPQVKRAAQVRLLMAADRLMAQLLMIAEDKSEPTSVRLAAIRDALDRAGLGAKQQIEIAAEVTTQSWESRITAAVVDWGELEQFVRPTDPNEVEAEVVDDYAPQDATLDVSERPDPHRMQRLAEVAEEVKHPLPQPSEAPPWVSEESGAQTAKRLADEHRKQAFAAEKSSKGLTPLTTRPRR